MKQTDTRIADALEAHNQLVVVIAKELRLLRKNLETLEFTFRK